MKWKKNRNEHKLTRITGKLISQPKIEFSTSFLLDKPLGIVIYNPSQRNTKSVFIYRFVGIYVTLVNISINIIVRIIF